MVLAVVSVFAVIRDVRVGLFEMSQCIDGELLEATVAKRPLGGLA